MLHVRTLAFALLSCPALAQPAPSPAPSPTPASTPAVARFAGTVLDAGQKPLAGARVVVRGETGEAVVARTDAAGAFSVECRERGPWHLSIDAAGHAPRRLRNQKPGAGLRLTLERGLAIEGRVVDGATRQPVTGARVTAAESMRDPGANWLPGLGQRVATTDAEGRFRIDNVGRGFLDLAASAPGIGAARLRNVRAGARPELLVLLPMGGLQGVVVDADGTGLGGATVRLEPAPGTRGSTQTVTAGGDGRFSADGLEPGSWRAVARAAEHAPAWTTATVEREAVADVELRLGPRRAVSGRTLDERDAAVSQAYVTWVEADGEPVPESIAVTTNAGRDGRFRVEGLPPGRHRLEARAAGYVPERFEVSIARGDGDAGDVRLARGLTVRGLVRGPDGRPVPDAHVHADMGPMPVVRQSAETWTDAEGRFVLPGLPPGTHNLAASADGVGRGRGRAETGAEDVVITLRAWGAIRGVAVDERGEPVAPMRASARSPEVFGGRGEEFADPGGVFELNELEAGSYTVEVRAPGRVRVALPSIAVTSGAVTDVGTVVLRGGGSVVGSVVDKAGSPIVGAEVSGRQGQRFVTGDETVAITDVAGQFELGGFAAGPVQLAASHALFAPANATVEVDPAQGPAEARLTLFTGGRLEGRLARRDGSPVTLGRINVMSVNAPMGGLGLLQPDADGRFVAERLAPGRVRVTWLKGEGGRFESAQMREVEIADGETSTVDIVAAEIRVSGRITRGGQPLPGVRVQVTGTQSMRMMFVAGTRGPGGAAETPPGVTREDGSYELTVDQPGPAQVAVVSLDGRTRYPARDVQIPDAESHVLDVDLPAALVRGTVVDAEGRPLEATLMLTPKGGRTGAFARSGADGRFELGVDPGEWTLTAREPGYSATPLALTVPEAGLEDVRVVLAPGRALRGRVVDATGRGLAGAMITVQAAGPVAPAESGPDGRFELTSVPDAAVSVAAASATGAFALRTGVRAGDEEVVLRLRPGALLKARVVGPDGAPVAGAYVFARFPGGPSVSAMRVPTTDAGGAVELPVPAGLGVIEVTASAGGGLSATITLQPGEAADLEAEIALKPPPAPGTPPGV